MYPGQPHASQAELVQLAPAEAEAVVAAGAGAEAGAGAGAGAGLSSFFRAVQYYKYTNTLSYVSPLS